MTAQYGISPDTDALIVVDVQRDFCRGGVLVVPDGEAVIPVLNRWLQVEGLLKIATRDWYPADHRSFQSQGGPWPPHCVQHTPGAELHQTLNAEAIDVIVSKGTAPDAEGYSAFDAKELVVTLRTRDILRVWIGGLALDGCVKATALDACKLGLVTFVIEDAVRCIDMQPGDCARAWREMAKAGVKRVATAEISGVP